MAPAMMFLAGMTVSAGMRFILCVMMLAMRVGIVLQRSFKKGFGRLIRTAFYPAEKRNSRLSQRCFGAAADSSANQNVYPVFF